ncbi:MAG: hypothetical protein WAT09_02930, partial [Paracoccaceae bacterium]
ISAKMKPHSFILAEILMKIPEAVGRNGQSRDKRPAAQPLCFKAAGTDPAALPDGARPRLWAFAQGRPRFLTPAPELPW